MPQLPRTPGGGRQALLLARPVLAACPAPSELEEPPELLLLPVEPAARKLSRHASSSDRDRDIYPPAVAWAVWSEGVSAIGAAGVGLNFAI